MATLTFDDYMRSYAEDHQHPYNRALHLVGIPMILASLPAIPLAPPVGIAMFTTGWALQFAGHYFEGKPPAFTRDPRYLAVGAVWAAVEWAEILTGAKLYQPAAPATPAE
jgi:uncharacterized membrane protein YGL010W